MGYDMTILGDVEPTHPAVVSAAERAMDSIQKLRAVKQEHEFLDSSVRHDEQGEIEQPMISHLMDLKYPGYFHLNIWSMDGFLSVMLDIGMAHTSTVPISPHEWDTLPDPDVEDWDAYLAAQDMLTSRHSTADPSIPTHKLSTNDGWVITVSELSHALNKWKDYSQNPISIERPDIVRTVRWAQWIEYLQLGFCNGGIHVS